MSLDLPLVLPQMQELGREAVQRAADMKNRLPQALEMLHKASTLDSDRMQFEIAQAGDRWWGATPAEEPINHVAPPPPALSHINIIGVDGSQIYPDRHRVFTYYLINIGSILIAYGSGNAPQTFSRPRIFFNRHELHDDAGRLLSPTLINGKRDAAEMGEIARLAEGCSGEPTLALLDNNLLLQIGLHNGDGLTATASSILRDYSKYMARVRTAGASLAGLIDRPRSTDLLALLGLIAGQRNGDRFQGLTDQDLYASVLPPEHRSAIFRLETPHLRLVDKEVPPIYFFYLSTDPGRQIVRVEIPEWVAGNPILVDQVVAGILKDCQSTSGYPYSLVRAHELALVTDSERIMLEGWLASILMHHGLRPRFSQKALTKLWLTRRRRHRVRRS